MEVCSPIRTSCKNFDPRRAASNSPAHPAAARPHPTPSSFDSTVAHLAHPRNHRRHRQDATSNNAARSPAAFPRCRRRSFCNAFTCSTTCFFRSRPRKYQSAKLALLERRLFRDRPRQRAFIQRHPRQHADVQLLRQRKQPRFGRLIENVVNHLHRIASARCASARCAESGSPVIDRNAHVAPCPTSSNPRTRAAISSRFDPFRIPHMKLLQIDMLATPDSAGSARCTSSRSRKENTPRSRCPAAPATSDSSAEPWSRHKLHRSPARSRPPARSLCPSPYTSAVSMKLTPSSIAL